MNKTPCSIKTAPQLPQKTYQVSRVIDLAMSAELSLDVLITEQTHLVGQVLAVGAEQAAVELNGRQERHHAGTLVHSRTGGRLHGRRH